MVLQMVKMIEREDPYKKSTEGSRLVQLVKRLRVVGNIRSDEWDDPTASDH